MRILRYAFGISIIVLFSLMEITKGLLQNSGSCFSLHLIPYYNLLFTPL